MYSVQIRIHPTYSSFVFLRGVRFLFFMSCPYIRDILHGVLRTLKKKKERKKERKKTRFVALWQGDQYGLKGLKMKDER